MDQLLFDCPDGCSVLSSLLQLCVLQLAVLASTENSSTIIQLRGHFDEFVGVARHTKTTHQSYTEKGL